MDAAWVCRDKRTGFGHEGISDISQDGARPLPLGGLEHGVLRIEHAIEPSLLAAHLAQRIEFALVKSLERGGVVLGFGKRLTGLGLRHSG